jgi:ATP-dependent DNA helicase PIF1
VHMSFLRLFCSFKFQVGSRKQGVFFITGGAGTGKSDLIRSLVSCLQLAGFTVGISASSGAAAVLLAGVTLHCYLGMLMDLTFKDNNAILYQLRELDVLFIDEISMLSSKMMDALDQRLRDARNSTELFGGATIIFVGDLYQLPPVLDSKKHLSKMMLSVSSDALDFPIYVNKKWSYVTPLFLIENMRQSKDKYWASVLDDARVGKITNESMKFLRSREVPLEEAYRLAIAKGIRIIASKRDVVKTINEYLHCHVGDQTDPGHTFKAIDRDHLSQDLTSSSLIQYIDKHSALLPVVTMRQGSKVVLRRNLNVQDGEVNGMLGEVVAIQKDGNYVRVAKKDGHDCFVTPQVDWIPVPNGTSVSRTQIPLQLGYASTIHASQGQTMDACILVADNLFAHGMLYTALSRTKDSDNMYITWFHKDPQNHLSVVIDEKVREVMEELQKKYASLGRIPDGYNEAMCSALLGSPPTSTSTLISTVSSFSTSSASSSVPTTSTSIQSSSSSTDSISAKPQDPVVPPFLGQSRWFYQCIQWADNGCGPDALIEALYCIYRDHPHIFDTVPFVLAIMKQREQDQSILSRNTKPPCRIQMYNLIRENHKRQFGVESKEPVYGVYTSMYMLVHRLFVQPDILNLEPGPSAFSLRVLAECKCGTSRVSFPVVPLSTFLSEQKLPISLPDTIINAVQTRVVGRCGTCKQKHPSVISYQLPPFMFLEYSAGGHTSAKGRAVEMTAPTLTIGTTVYKLYAMLFYRDNHFTAQIRYGDQFYAYDDLARSGLALLVGDRPRFDHAYDSQDRLLYSLYIKQ